jgi:hypothetical protein
VNLSVVANIVKWGTFHAFDLGSVSNLMSDAIAGLELLILCNDEPILLIDIFGARKPSDDGKGRIDDGEENTKLTKRKLSSETCIDRKIISAKSGFPSHNSRPKPATEWILPITPTSYENNSAVETNKNLDSQPSPLCNMLNYHTASPNLTLSSCSRDNDNITCCTGLIPPSKVERMFVDFATSSGVGRARLVHPTR